MPSKFITNQETLLSNVINDILPTTDKLYFLVGYFYFSGFEELYKNLADKEIKVLIGMDIERTIFNKVKEFEIIQEVSTSLGKIKDNYFSSLVQLFNDTDFFDTKEKQQAFKLFLDKIRDGSLEIKKTIKPNHSKLYLFQKKQEHNEGGQYPGVVITGSSNLSISGLTGRHEINVVFRDEHYDEGKKLFDELWTTAIDIVTKDNTDAFFSNVVEKIWIDKLPSPFLMYVRVLDEFFSVKADRLRLPAEITKDKYINLKYQTNAIQQALKVINNHNGVIIADVVGLGKSIIASTIAHNLGLKTIIICPPHLVEQWKDYRFSYDFVAEVFSSGSIDKALKLMDNEEKLIIVDEAHKYRNEMTLDYANLHRLCQGNKVVLLTATPFNNRPQDIFSMVKLFQLPAKSTIQTVDNLHFQFKLLIKEYKDIRKSQKNEKEPPEIIKKRIQSLAKQIRELISPLVIRRSRLDLQEIDEFREDLKIQKIELNIVEPPKLMDYDLGPLSKLYINTLEKISPFDNDQNKTSFIGARYKPTAYIKEEYIESYKEKFNKEFGDENLFLQSQLNLSKFMRRLLVRRFESSVFSFHQSLNAMILSSQLIKDWYERFKKIPIYKKGALPDVDSLLEDGGIEMDIDPEDINFDELLKTYNDKGLQLIDADHLTADFIKDVKHDISILTDIYNDWFKNGITGDPKLTCFKKQIKTWLQHEPGRKIIVFSEFADTAQYLYEQLNTELKVFLYTSNLANQKNKEIIRSNFDAGIKAAEQENDYDVLIATDAISEGFNLHRAGIIFNYDIPYNPTRVIQRVGRINRINKKVFDRLYIFNFFPTSTGEEEIHIKQITTLKIDMIHALLGEDTKILTKDEELESFYKEQYESEMSKQEASSWDNKYFNMLNNLKSQHPEIIHEARNIPKRSRIKRTVAKDKTGIIVFGRKGPEYKFKLGNSEQDITLPPAEAIELFTAETSEKSVKVSDSFAEIYTRLKNNLFERKTQLTSDKGKRDTVAALQILNSSQPKYKDYINDLLNVIVNLDSLPDYFMKRIRAIDLDDPDMGIKQLINELPHEYVTVMLDKAQKIEEGEEVLILSEELID